MGTRNLQSSGVQYTDQRDFYISPRVVKELWPSIMPFVTVISNGNVKEKGDMPDTIFKMFEHRNPWRRQYFYNNGDSVTISASTNAESSAMSVDNITGLSSSVDDSYVGLEIECWDSSEVTLRGTAIITSVVSSTDIKLKNLDGATDISTVDNDVWRVVGNAHGEGASAPEAWADELHMAWNSTQEFRTSLEISRKMRKAVLRGERKELDRIKKIKAGEWKMQRERAMLFGRNPVGTNLDTGSADTFTDATGASAAWRTDANGHKLRTTMGIFTCIEKYGNSSGDDQNLFEFNEAAWTWDDYVDMSEKIFQYLPNSGYKRAFCGRGVMSILSKMSKNGIAGNSGWRIDLSGFRKDRLGFNYRALETNHGILQCIPTPGIDGPRNKWMIIVDTDNLFHAIYEPAEYHQNIKTDNKPTLQKDEYWGDEGIGVTNIETHTLVKFH